LGGEAQLRWGWRRNGRFSQGSSFLATLGFGAESLRGAYVAAFTLIEMMIALAISGIILVVLNGFFFGALHLRSRAMAAAEETRPVDRAVAIMKQDLLGIVPPGMLAGAMGSDAAPVGMTQQPLLELYSCSATLSADAPWGDVQKIDYSLQPPANRNGAAGQELMRGVTRNLLPAGTVVPEQKSLLSGVQSLTFTYYDGTNWDEVWSTTQSNIPIAIKVAINFAASKTDTQLKLPVVFLVPIVTWSSTNSMTNSMN
jgi:prepilin-type N-terminal cleavage/methylation domain-containing protein